MVYIGWTHCEESEEVICFVCFGRLDWGQAESADVERLLFSPVVAFFFVGGVRSAIVKGSLIF